MKTQKWIMLMMVAALFVAGCEKHDPAKCAKAVADKAKTADKADAKVADKTPDKADAEVADVDAAKADAEAKAKEAEEAKIKAGAEAKAKEEEALKIAAAAKAKEEAAAKAAAAKPVAAGQVELKIDLPEQRIDGTPQPPKNEPNMETSKPKGYTRPAFYVPSGTINLAKGKTVTVSEEPMVGELSQIVDGNAESTDETTLDLDFGPAWVVVDLGKECEIFAVLMWHRHSNIYVFHDVIVEVSSDPDFLTSNVLFNNDHDGSLCKGHKKGTDKQYIETYEGKLIDAKGVKARYVRFWSNGNTVDDSNFWIEAMVFGR